MDFEWKMYSTLGAVENAKFIKSIRWQQLSDSSFCVGFVGLVAVACRYVVDTHLRDTERGDVPTILISCSSVPVSFIRIIFNSVSLDIKIL